ncbi:hypothetical protein BJ322DRAFT_713224 [Thelephora terrestris]|uniref:Uncharacterized protein n=1 Tax=Thelephora terrestris TaxID=56493 RepID=A0A9P6HHI2_9AGAM|nr:hypothetical protein BJ322DRAFT_713224 [Thelephora terrestris]
MRHRATSVPYYQGSMSAPPILTTRDLSGKYILNKRLSDSTDKIFKEQGVGWIARLRLSSAPIVTAWIRHFRERGREYLEIDEMFHKRNSTTTERYALDGRPLEFDDVCGRPAVSRGWKIRTTEIKDQFLRRGWVNDVLSHSAIYTKVEGYIRGDLKRRWIEEQTMGFQDIAGDRRFVRHVKLTTEKGEVVEVRLVYDYCDASFDVTKA